MDTTVIVPLITGSGVAGIFCALFILGKIHSDSEYKREQSLRAEEKQRADILEQALKEKDKALEAANDRADAAVRASELIADAFTEARRRRGGGRAGTGHGT